jgi:hypothetical protein
MAIDTLLVYVGVYDTVGGAEAVKKHETSAAACWRLRPAPAPSSALSRVTPRRG